MWSWKFTSAITLAYSNIYIIEGVSANNIEYNFTAKHALQLKIHPKVEPSNKLPKIAC